MRLVEGRKIDCIKFVDNVIKWVKIKKDTRHDLYYKCVKYGMKIK